MGEGGDVVVGFLLVEGEVGEEVLEQRAGGDYFVLAGEGGLRQSWVLEMRGDGLAHLDGLVGVDERQRVGGGLGRAVDGHRDPVGF